MLPPGLAVSDLVWLHEEAGVTPESGERTRRAMMSFVAVLAAAVGSAYLVFLWLN